MMKAGIRLGDICDILNGFAFKSEKYVCEGVRIIRIANVQKGYLEDSAPQYYPLETASELKKYMLEEGDILMSLTGNVGRVAQLSANMLPAALNQRVACLRLKDSAGISKDFLFQFLNSDYFESHCILSSKGIAQKNMSTEWLKEYEIPLFTPKEQMVIASQLSKIDILIAVRYQMLVKLDELVKSRFVEMFGDPVQNPMSWKTGDLATICMKITDGEHGSVPRIEEGNAFLNAKHVKKDGSIDWSTVTYIANEDHNRIYARCNPEPGDILLTTTGTIGNVAIVPNVAPFSVDRGITLLKLDAVRVNNQFLATLLNYDCIQTIMKANIHASAIGHLFLNKVMQIPVIIPPLETQKRFSAFVTEVDKSKLAVKQSLEKLETLKKSLMQQYFG